MAKKVKKLKLKTHRGAAKRFMKTGSGKIVRGAALKRHLLTSKTTTVKPHARGNKLLTPGDARKNNFMLPYK